MRHAVVAVELVVAVLAVVGAFLCWNVGVRTTRFEEVPGAAPAFDATHYSGSWIAVAAVAVLAAGLLVVDASRRLRS